MNGKIKVLFLNSLSLKSESPKEDTMPIKNKSDIFYFLLQ